MKLELKNINKSFGTKQVLSSISLETVGGKAFGLLGRNGAGKTTTIRILMNVIPANAGEILIDGAPIDYREIKLGYLPEERGLYPKKVVLEQLVYFSMLHGMSRKDAVREIDRWLERLGMSEYRNKRLDTLSKGNQQKIQLVTALAHDPDIVILDEPFSGLDPVNAQLLKDVVREEIARGKIVLFSSHQMSYIEEFCNRIAILNQGKVVLQGELDEIKRDYPRDRLVVRCEDKAALRDAFGSACSEMENGALLLRLKNAGEKDAVMRELTARFSLDELRVFEPSLNDIFVEYAGDTTEEETA